MKKFILGFLLASMTAYAATEFGDLVITGSTTSVGNLSTQGFLTARTGIASQNGGTLRLHETDVNGGSKVTVQTVSNLAADYRLEYQIEGHDTESDISHHLHGAYL